MKNTLEVIKFNIKGTVVTGITEVTYKKKPRPRIKLGKTVTKEGKKYVCVGTSNAK